MRFTIPQTNYLCYKMDLQSNISFEHWLQSTNITYDKGCTIILSNELVSSLYVLEDQVNISLLEFKSSETLTSQDTTYKTIKTIQLWQDQWIHQQQIVTGRILSLLGRSDPIYARKTILKKITQEETDHFLNHNHLQGSTKAKIKYGLYYKEVLVSVATFTWPRKFYKEDRVYLSYGLIRHCNLNGHHVIGGLSKILAQLQKDYAVDDIMTFVDLDWSEGLSYQQLGFELIERTQPEIFYIDRETLKRYDPKEMERLGKSAQHYYEIQNSGNNKYKLFTSSD